MKIDNIKLYNYRNYVDDEIFFDDGLNVIIGKNGMGKTNLLEAIYYCSIGKSLRLNKDKELINFNNNLEKTQENAKITLNLQKNEGKIKIEIILSKKTKKIVKINDVSILRIGDLLGTLTTVYFSPDEIRLIKDSPDFRRRFLDICLSQMDKSYFYNLLRFEKIIDHRNKLIKSASRLKDIAESISIFTMQAADIGAKIVYDRNKFIDKLTPFLKQAHNELTNNKENIELNYLGIKGSSVLEIKENLLKEYERTLNRDFELKYTQVGPHRDDFKILINNIDVRLFGSQGQQRTATLSLKLAELEIFKENDGEYPVLLLDDVLSELDKSRQEKLLDFCKKTQVIITSVDFKFLKLKKETNFIKIENGKNIPKKIVKN